MDVLELLQAGPDGSAFVDCIDRMMEGARTEYNWEYWYSFYHRLRDSVCGEGRTLESFELWWDDVDGFDTFSFLGDSVIIGRRRWGEDETDSVDVMVRGLRTGELLGAMHVQVPNDLPQ